MFHMLTCFNLKPTEDLVAFRSAYADFIKYMQRENLVESCGPIGRRQSDTKMDTDAERKHEYFVITSFRDRAQVDSAYAHLKPHQEPSEAVHKAVYSKVQNPIFICWQDL